MKIPIEVQKQVDALTPETRVKVEAIVRRHLDACRRMGVEVEYLDRIWIEAMDMVRIDEKFAETMDEEWPEFEPIRRYDVYTSPNDTRV